MADSLSLSLFGVGVVMGMIKEVMEAEDGSDVLDDEEDLCKDPVSTPPHASCRLCRLWLTSRLCFLLPPAAVPPNEPLVVLFRHSFSADWTLFSSGDRGGSALLGREICRTIGGEECSFTGKAGAPADRGEGDLGGDPACCVGDGVRASGDRGMFPADFLLGDRYCLCSL